MASANKPENKPENKAAPALRPPLHAAKRRQLQQLFEHATKYSNQGNFDQAVDLLTQCLIGDPGNLIYIQQFLSNLYKKYNNNKKGSKLTMITGATTKGAIKKATYSKDWNAVIKSGLEFLKLNPWDISTLWAMAEACDNFGCPEAQLTYLKCALEVNSKDIETNRRCAKALGRMGQYDQAVACWHRVKVAKPDDEEAQQAMGDLAVEKTIAHGGYEDAKSSTDVMTAKSAAISKNEKKGPVLTREQELEQAIAASPENIETYLLLADLHTQQERHGDAVTVYEQALQASGGDLGIRERMEDAQLRHARSQLVIAERRAEEDKSAEAIELAKKIFTEVNRSELEVYRARADRYPTNLALRFELGLRFKRAGQMNDAIQCFQVSRNDARRKCQVHLELGECFEQIRQQKLAMTNYEIALDASSERDMDQRKLVLYRAGVLALEMKDVERADKYLTELASHDFGYKDVPERLDKIAQIRNNE